MLACLHCGRELSPRAVACPQCGEPGPAAPLAGRAGAPPPPPPGAMPAPPPAGRATYESVMASVNRTDPYAIASIVCAVANFFALFLVGAILAVIFGKMAHKRIAADPSLGGAELARAGILVGWVGIGLVVAFLLLGITAFGVFSSSLDLPAVRFTS